MARTVSALPRGVRVSDHVTLGVLTTTMPASLIDAVLADTERASVRQCSLPARLVVYYVMALALYGQASYGEVLRCLLEGVRWLCRGGDAVALATKSSITKARRRLGVAPLAELYRRVGRPLATPGLPGAFYRDHRLVSLDGTTLELPDTAEIDTRFGRPAASRGMSAYPQLRLLALAETGTHAIFAAAFDAYAVAETTLAGRLLDRLQPGMLCLADRGFVGFELWQAACATKAESLWRLRANQVFACETALPDGSYLSHLYVSPAHRRRREGGVLVRVIDYQLDGVPAAGPVYRLITTLLDPATAPASELAALYHERWEAEVLFAEIKVTLPGRRLMLRSRRADLVEQEVYGLLLAHFALRHLMVQASQALGAADARDPDTLSFLHTVHVVRRHLPLHAAFSPRRRQRMLVMILAEIRAVPAERSRGRHNPRVVKRKMSNFPTRSRAAATDHRRWSYEDHIHILPPTDLQPPAPLPKTPEPVSEAELPTITADRRAATPDRQQVKAWRASGLSRADYCRRHALNPNTFNRWVD